MGYLSQKKKSIREHNFFMISGVVLTIVSLFLLFFDAFSGGKNFLFILYLINIIVLIYAIVRLQITFALYFMLLVCINFFYLTAYSRIFFNHSYDFGTDVSVSYDASSLTAQEVEGFSDQKWIHFDSQNKASYSDISVGEKNFKLIMLNFDTMSTHKRSENIKQLKNFILAQDLPVVVIGNFGTSVWQPEMRDLLNKTNLRVINRLVFAQKGSKGSCLRVPTFYVLSFDGFGLLNLKVKDPISKNYPIIDLVLRIKND